MVDTVKTKGLVIGLGQPQELQATTLNRITAATSMLASFRVVIWRAAFVNPGSHCVRRRTSKWTYAARPYASMYSDIRRVGVVTTRHCVQMLIICYLPLLSLGTCVAVRRNATCCTNQAELNLCGMLRPSTYDDALCVNAVVEMCSIKTRCRTVRQRTATHGAVRSVNGALMTVGYYR